MPSFNRALFLFCLVGLVGCDAPGRQAATLERGAIELPIPERIRSISAINLNNLSATATVNGVTVPLQLTGDGTYQADVEVPTRSTFPVVIEFSEQFAGVDLLLARQTQQVSTGVVDTRVSLRRSGYSFAFDDDSDSVDNIIEREENTDPLDASDLPELLDVSVLAQQPAGTPRSDRYIVEASLGNTVQVMRFSNNLYGASFRVPRRDQSVVKIEFVEVVTGRELVVASQSAVVALFDQQSIIASADRYNIEDRDGDGASDLAELAAGTDINNTANPVNVAFSVNFEAPAALQNTQSIYAELFVNDVQTGVRRNGDTFTANPTADLNDTVTVAVTFYDNFNQQPYPLSVAEKSIRIVGNGQNVQIDNAEFNLQIDSDSDGIANYLEREQGTDPFAEPPVAVVCSVNALPVVTAVAGETATLDEVSTYVNCNGAPYVLNAAQLNFSWNVGADTISWTVPDGTAADTTIVFDLLVVNPNDGSEVYNSADVSTAVKPDVCSFSNQTVVKNPLKDVYVEDGDVFNRPTLRVQADERVSLLGFELDDIDGDLVSAVLTLQVGADGGDGQVAVYQDASLQWSESDSSIAVPAFEPPIGGLSTLWQVDSDYNIGLFALDPSAGTTNLLLVQESGNDVAFTSRETDTPPVLTLIYNGCF